MTIPHDDATWARLTAEQFFHGYNVVDAVYDEKGDAMNPYIANTSFMRKLVCLVTGHDWRHGTVAKGLHAATDPQFQLYVCHNCGLKSWERLEKEIP